jgi:FtsP/CotA-like multicopper oxidase with cupredoxin domain
VIDRTKQTAGKTARSSKNGISKSLTARPSRMALAVSLALIAPATMQVAYAGVGVVCKDPTFTAAFCPPVPVIDPATGTQKLDGKGIGVTAPNTIGTYYANSPTLRKFVDTLPGLTAGHKNTFDKATKTGAGEYISVATADTKTYPGSEYFVIGVVEHKQWMHSDLQDSTTMRSYVQIYPQGQTSQPAGSVALTYPNNNPIYWKDATGADTTEQVYGYDNPHYLGPIILTTTGTPVRVKMVNFLPTGRGTASARNGDMFLPVDESLAGAGLAPGGDKYPQNRVAFHLHGGDSPWISDGTPHQWIAAAGDSTPFKKGDRFMNAPDMPYPGDGAQTIFWPNDQSSRLMWYHDHTFGLTRQNAYSGAAAGYVIIDAAELALLGIPLSSATTLGGALAATPVQNMPQTVNGQSISKVLPGSALDQLVLVIQDKTWVPDDIATQDSKWDQTHWGKPGDLWYPHVYEPAQLWGKAPVTDTAIDFNTVPQNPAGRWDYAVSDATGLYLPPTVGLGNLRSDADYGDVAFTDGSYADGTPGKGPSATPESYMDTPVVNGVAYPTITVDPKAYRIRFLNGANDRYWNLSLWKADANTTSADGRTNTEVVMVLADGTTYTLTDGSKVTVPNDARPGGVPDPRTAGPSVVQFANEAGFLPTPVVYSPAPMDLNPASLEETKGGFYLGGAERADTVIDFSNFAGETLILYNDSTAPVPGGDPRYDYYTGGPDQTAFGGAPSTAAGYGPNTRTVMQIKVSSNSVTPDYPTVAGAYDVSRLTTELGKAYKAVADQHIAGPMPVAADIVGNTINVQEIDPATGLPAVTTSGARVITNRPLLVKTIRGFTDPNYGRLIAQIGVELPGGDSLGTPLAYIDSPTDIINAGDTQYWWIKNNDVDNHPMHFHLFNVQVVAHRAHDLAGTLRPPEPEEMGWKETVKNWPGEDVIVAVRPKTPALPFGLPNSNRLLDPTLVKDATANDVLYGTSVATDPNRGAPEATPGFVPFAFNQYDLDATHTSASTSPTGTKFGDLLPIVSNTSANFGWEYVWHCHILGHEENDLMRPMVYFPTITAPGKPSVVGADANSLITWIDPTPAADSLTKGNSSNEIGFRVERTTVTNGTPDAAGWKTMTGTDSDQYVIGTVNTLANATSIQDLPVGTTDYAYRVAAVNADATETTSDVYYLVKPAAPTGVTVGTTQPASATAAGTVSISWTNNSGATTPVTGFRIERAPVTGSTLVFSAIGSVAATSTSFSDKNVVAGTDYQYQVVAINGPKETTSSATSFNQAPTAPGKFAVSTAGAITWVNTSLNAPTFTITRAPWSSATSSAGAVTNTYNVAAGSEAYTDASFTANTDYLYTITAVNPGDATLKASTTFTLTSVPVAASGVQVSSAGLVTWQINSTNQTGFRIDRAQVTSGGVVGTAAILGTTSTATDTQFPDLNVVANTDYQYVVVALNGTLASAASLPATLSQAPKPATALGLATGTVATATGLTLGWADNSSNEAGFSVDSQIEGSSAPVSLTTTAANVTSYAVAGLTPGRAYTFRVAATKSGFTPASTDYTTWTTPAALVAPTALTVVSELNPTGQAVLNWTDNSIGETGYSVERCAGTTTTCTATKGSWTVLSNTLAANTATFTDLNLATAGTYVYRVKALNGATAGAALLSAQVATAIAVTAPTNLTVSTTGTGATLSWIDQSTNETSFQVDRLDHSTTATTLTPLPAGAVTRTTALKAATGGKVTFTDATALAGGSYDYQVRAVNTTGTTVSSSAPSNVQSITLGMPVPTGLTAVQSGGNIALSWIDTSATESGFIVERSTDGGATWTTTATAAAPSVARTGTLTTGVNGKVSYSDTTAVPGQQYSYRVYAIAAGTTALPANPNATASVSATLVLPAPTLLSTGVSPAGSVVLNWVDNATFESAYRIDRSIVSVDATGAMLSGQSPVWQASYATLNRTGNVVATTGAVTYTDTAAPALLALNGVAQAYAYQVYAATANGVSLPSNVTHSTAAAPTGAPTALTANTSTGTSITLSWVDNTTTETGFDVERTPSPASASSTWQLLKTVARTGTQTTTANTVVSYPDTLAAIGTSYDYRVTAVIPAKTVAGVTTPAARLVSPTITAGLTLNAPTNATAAAAPTGIKVGWTDASKNETGFEVVRNVAKLDLTGKPQSDATGLPLSDGTAPVVVSPAVTATTANTTTGTVGSFIDTTAAFGVTYFYTVSAVNGTARSPVAYTAPSTITETIVSPSTPTAVITNGTTITVTWTDLSTNETGFNVARSADGGGTWTALGATVPTVARTGTATTGTNTAVSYADKLGAVYGSYIYQVTAVNTGAVVSGTSTPVLSAPVDFNLPAAPIGLTATAGAVGSLAVTLNWTDVATNETGYSVQRATDAAFTKGLVTTAVPGAVASGPASYVVTGLKKGTKYFFRVAATNVVGTSATVATGTAVAAQ